MDLIHITSLSSAIKIMSTGLFHPFSSNPSDGDSGMNCFDLSGPKTPQHFEGCGAILLLEWTGGIIVNNISSAIIPPYPLNTLIDNSPWRCFIPRDNNPDLLLLKGIDFTQDEYKKYFGYPWWFRFLGKHSYDEKSNDYFKNKMQELNERLSNSSVKIKIC